MNDASVSITVLLIPSFLVLLSNRLHGKSWRESTAAAFTTAAFFFALATVAAVITAARGLAA